MLADVGKPDRGGVRQRGIVREWTADGLSAKLFGHMPICHERCGANRQLRRHVARGPNFLEHVRVLHCVTRLGPADFTNRYHGHARPKTEHPGRNLRLWTLPPGDTDFPRRWQMIKASSRSVGPAASRRPSLVRKRESRIWQRRYREHTVRDDRDYAAHMDYIHFNPVKHSLAKHPADWPHSSFARCVSTAATQPIGQPPQSSRTPRESVPRTK